MPYIQVTLASGRPRELKRPLIGELTDTMERVLEVARSDIHMLKWEITRIGEAGILWSRRGYLTGITSAHWQNDLDG